MPGSDEGLGLDFDLEGVWEMGLVEVLISWVGLGLGWDWNEDFLDRFIFFILKF